MKKFVIAGLAAALGFGAVGESKAAWVDTVINFSGTTALVNDPPYDFWSPVMVTLDPGTYQFTPVRTPFTGATYDGFYSFGNGWYSSGYNVAVNDKYHITHYYADGSIATDPDSVFAHATGGSLTLSQTSNVYFGVGDSMYFDNGGGISLHLTGGTTPPVPEPETYGMMMAGLALLGFIGRRKQKQAS